MNSRVVLFGGAIAIVVALGVGAALALVGTGSSRTSGLVNAGLGGTVEEFRFRYGEPRVTTPPYADFGDLYAIFNENGHAATIERRWPGAARPSLNDAKRLGLELLPRDAALIESYRSRDGALVDRYRSMAIRERFPNARFVNGEPGDFILVVRPAPDQSTATLLVIALGNNP